MKKILFIPFILALVLTGCNTVKRSPGVYSKEIDGRNITAELANSDDGSTYLNFMVDNEFIGINHEKGGFLSKDKQSYYYIDNASSFDIYEDGQLLEPIEAFNRGKNNVSIYQFSASKEVIAYPKGTTNFDGIAKAYVMTSQDGYEWKRNEVQVDENELFELVLESEEFEPQYHEIAMESVGIQPHRVVLQYASMPFNSEYIQFFENTEDYTMGVDETTFGILQIKSSQLYDETEGKYYYLTNQQMEEFDRITKYNEVMK